METIKFDGDLSVGPCFVCGSGDLASRAQPRRRYAELTSLFKTLVMTTDLRKKLGGSSVLTEFSTNVESCATCLATIKDVYDLRQEIVALQTQLDELLEVARTKLGQIPVQKLEQQKGLQISEPNSSRKRKMLTEEEHEVEFQIKEELQDCEIIPDIFDSMEMEPSEMIQDAEFGNDTPSGDDDDTQDHNDSDYVPSPSATKSLSKRTRKLRKNVSTLNPNTTSQTSETSLHFGDDNDNDDTSSSSDEEDDAAAPGSENVVEKIPRKIKDWENVANFENMEEAKKFISERKECVYKNTYHTKDAVTLVYVCRQARSCSAKWRIRHPTGSVVLHVEKTVSEHDHVPRKGRGIPAELKEEIVKLLASGTKKPTAILSTLTRGGITPPSRSQLVNFLATNKKR